MNLWWECPNCKRKVDFVKEMSAIFEEDGESVFDPSSGIGFHGVMCECGAAWWVSMSEMDTSMVES